MSAAASRRRRREALLRHRQPPARGSWRRSRAGRAVAEGRSAERRWFVPLRGHAPEWAGPPDEMQIRRFHSGERRKPGDRGDGRTGLPGGPCEVRDHAHGRAAFLKARYHHAAPFYSGDPSRSVSQQLRMGAVSARVWHLINVGDCAMMQRPRRFARLPAHRLRRETMESYDLRTVGEAGARPTIKTTDRSVLVTVPAHLAESGGLVTQARCASSLARPASAKFCG